MKIDIFNHILPEQYHTEFDKFTPNLKDMGTRHRVYGMSNLDERFRVMDEFGEYCQVISLASPPIEAIAGPEHTTRLASIGNDGLADLVRRHPKRFPGFVAGLPMNDPDAALKELQRAAGLGALGVQLYSNVNGKPLDSPEFKAIFDELARLDLAVWLHPARNGSFADYKTETRSKYEIWWTFGWPYETSVAMSHLVFSGLFDRHPNFRIITHHMGAMIPYFEGRVGYGWDQLGKRSAGEGNDVLLASMKKRPYDYFKMFLADTALFGSVAGTQCGLAFFGLDNVLFASDTPFEPTPGLYIRDTIRVIESLGLSAADKEKVYRGNAERLLKLKLG